MEHTEIMTPSFVPQVRRRLAMRNAVHTTLTPVGFAGGIFRLRHVVSSTNPHQWVLLAVRVYEGA